MPRLRHSTGADGPSRAHAAGGKVLPHRGPHPETDAEETPLGAAANDALLAEFRRCSRALLGLAAQCEALEDHESAEGLIDTLAMLKEVQTECEERRTMARERRRQTARERAAAKAAAPPPLPPKPQGPGGAERQRQGQPPPAGGNGTPDGSG